MKFNALAILPALLLGAAQVSAECVPGKQEEVVPAYEVEYKCNTYRTGNLHKDIATIEACAEICRDAGSEYCSYGPKHKRCVVGDAAGEDKPSAGVYYMKKLDDPFPEEPETEPFPTDCEDDKAACESEKDDLDGKLKACETRVKACEARAKAAAFSFNSANCPRDTRQEVNVRESTYKLYCGRHHDAASPKATISGSLTLAECIDYCSKRSWCDYALFNPTERKCNAYERKVGYTAEPGVASTEWQCAVKKR